MVRKALITGIPGQDGAYLARLLLEKGYEVIGGVRAGSQGSLLRLTQLGIAEKVVIAPMELLEITNIQRVLERYEPDEVYNLAAQSFVAVSFEQPVYTSDVNALGALRLLEAIRMVNPKIRFYQASTSEMFGIASGGLLNESSSFHPRSPYAFAKAFAHYATLHYREAYGIFATSGICFNHESPLRGEEFVTRKITLATSRIKAGLQKKLLLGNMNAERDWGYSPEYVEAMWRMLQQEKPDDFVIATGEAHSVREFTEQAFSQVGLDWKEYVETDSRYIRPTDVERLRGDASKARQQLQWEAKTSFPELVGIMVRSDLKSLGIEI